MNNKNTDNATAGLAKLDMHLEERCWPFNDNVGD